MKNTLRYLKPLSLVALTWGGIAFLTVGSCAWLSSPSALGLWDRISGLPKLPASADQIAFFEEHRSDFAAAAEYIEQEGCGYCLNPAPEPIRAWAGEGTELHVCRSDVGEIGYAALITPVGTFSYIPNQTEIPRVLRPCIGKIAECWAEFGDGWYLCATEVD